MWLLSPRSISQYLLNHIADKTGKLLLSSNDIGLGMFGVYEILDVSRNSCFIVSIGIDNYFLKQPKDFAAGAIQSIKNESAFYRFISDNKIECNHLLKFKDFDLSRSVLILETNLNYQKVDTNTVLKQDFVRSFLDVLSELHEKCRYINKDKYLPYYKPILLNKAERNQLYIKMGQFPDKSLRDLEQKIRGIEEILDTIEWSSDESILHRDLKYQNLLIDRTNLEFSLKLIDWEMAAIGDKDWDIANFCYPILKSTFRAGRAMYDFDGWDETIAADFLINLIDLYDKTKTKKILQFCAIQIIEYYILGILNNRFESKTIKVEFKRVNLFFSLLTNSDKEYFNTYLT